MGVCYHTRTYERPEVLRESWHLQPESRERVLKNWRGIPKYLGLEYIAPVKRDGDAFI
jgi:hypothetical protein